jgi:hypothetical protein
MAWFSTEKAPLGGNDLFEKVTSAIEQTIGWTPGSARQPIPSSARLGADLGLSSIAVARLAGLLQRYCGRKRLPFHTLFVKPDGAMLQDIRVSDVVAFLERHLAETNS